MGMLGKLKFWKKEDDLGEFGNDLGSNVGTGHDMGIGQDNLGLGASTAPGAAGDLGLQTQPESSFPAPQEENIDYTEGFRMPTRKFPRTSEQAQPSPSPHMENTSKISEKNFEILSNKLDTIKVSLDNINHRLTLLEALARSSEREQTEHERRGPARRVW